MPLRGVGRPGRYNQMAVVCTAHNDGRGCVPYLPHQPAAAPRPKDDFGAAALCVTECGPRGPLPKQTVLQMRKFMKRRHSLLSVRRTRPAYGRTSDAKGFDALRLSTSDFAVDFTAGFAAVCTAESTAVRAAISREYAHLSTLSTELSTARAQTPLGSTEKALRRRPQRVEKTYFKIIMHKDETKQSKFQ